MAASRSVFDQLTCSFNVAPRPQLDRLTNDIFDKKDRGQVTSSDIRADELALLFVVLGMGAYYNLETAPDDSMIEDYLLMSKCALSKSDFMRRHTLASLQALVSSRTALT